MRGYSNTPLLAKRVWEKSLTLNIKSEQNELKNL